jgi:RHS repeat-associated protein
VGFYFSHVLTELTDDRESDQNMDVYFDDLKVTHKYSDIVAGGDYYPFGLAMEDRQITREAYKYGYQGQYSEKDEETGWNHFELREYDPVIGRWMTMDPAGQYPSPYVGMGNDPVNGIDPTGGNCDTCPDNGKYNDLIQSASNYYYDSKTNSTAAFMEEVTVVGQRAIGFDYLEVAIENYQAPGYFKSNPDDQTDYGPWSPDAIGLTVNGSFYYGLGTTNGFTFMYNFSKRESQFFGYVEGGAGWDASVGGGLTFVNFKDNDHWKDDYSEDYTTGEVAVLGLGLSHSENYNRRIRVHGDLTSSIGIGFSVGSDQTPFGIVSGKVSHGYTYKIWP